MSSSTQTARGTLDYDPQLMRRLQTITSVIRRNSLNLGAEEIDTPSIELTKVLLDKYGEDAENKLIYHLQKFDEVKSQDLSLRYDLTVPFQRYLAARPGIKRMKRFQTGKVYRKDRPYPTQGRFREFIQADFDIVGEYQPMVPEAEVMKLITSSLEQLNLRNFTIRYNFRDNLFRMVQLAKIPTELFKSVCISIDKLDKRSWEEVAQELITDRGLNSDQVNSLKSYLDQNYQDPVVQPLIQQLLEYGAIMGGSDRYLRFDSSLARGLDYYTGIIYEVVVDGFPTLVAGGRYDQLIKQKKQYLPAIGVSFGVNRLEMILGDRLPVDRYPFKIYVVSTLEHLSTKLKIVNFLLDLGYQADYYDGQRKNLKQINQAIKDNYQYILIYGEDGAGIKVKRNDQSSDRICNSLEELPELLRAEPFFLPPSSTESADLSNLI